MVPMVQVLHKNQRFLAVGLCPSGGLLWNVISGVSVTPVNLDVVHIMPGASQPDAVDFKGDKWRIM